VQRVLILLSSAEDEALTAEGQALLRDFRSSYQLRVGSAQVCPDYVREAVTSFHQAGGQVIVCLARPQDQLASFVASITSLPVLQVLAMGATPLLLEQLPAPIPVATFGYGAHGLVQASLFVLEILALQDQELARDVQRYRHSLAARLIAADQKHRVTFDV
jgi:phosphoribosylaminoimidazole carboxylase PurE protein